jgi:hypothetical protein
MNMISLLLAASGGALVGYGAAGVLLAAKIADLQRENAELRTELDASSFFTRFPIHPHDDGRETKS